MAHIDLSVYTHHIPDSTGERGGKIPALPLPLEPGLPFRMQCFLCAGRAAWSMREPASRLILTILEGSGRLRTGIFTTRYAAKDMRAIPRGEAFSFDEIRRDTVVLMRWGVFVPEKPVPKGFERFAEEYLKKKKEDEPRLLRGPDA